nr:DUF5697 family protein [uncultured Oscillibacter sp.]
MKTREQIYGQEAASILRDITMYRVLTKEQLLRLYPGKQNKVQNLLSFLTKQGRIINDGEYYAASAEALEDVDRWLLAAVWVLLDFIDRVEYHSTGDFPAKVIFFSDGEVYEIIQVEAGKEILVSQVLAAYAENPSRYLIMVDNLEQIAELNIPNVCGFCTVSLDGRSNTTSENKREEDIFEPSDFIPAYYFHLGGLEAVDQCALRHEHNRYSALSR